MDRICSFNEFVLFKEGNSRTALKTILYPLGYGGLGNYPPSSYIPKSADAILYISKDERLWCNGDKAPWDISHLPGHEQYGDKINNGEQEPWNINKIPGKVKKHSDHNLPGKEKAFVKFVKLVTKTKCVEEKPKNKVGG